MKVFLVFLFSMFLVSCFSTGSVYQPKIGEVVYLDPYNSWVNNCPKSNYSLSGKCKTSWRSITLRIVNKKYRNVDIKVVCSFDTGDKFSEKSITVNSRDSKVFTVWGLARSVPDADDISCRIASLR